MDDKHYATVVLDESLRPAISGSRVQRTTCSRFKLFWFWFGPQKCWEIFCGRPVRDDPRIVWEYLDPEPVWESLKIFCLGPSQSWTGSTEHAEQLSLGEHSDHRTGANSSLRANSSNTEQSEHQKFWRIPNRANSPNTYCSDCGGPWSWISRNS